MDVIQVIIIYHQFEQSANNISGFTTGDQLSWLWLVLGVRISPKQTLG